LEIRSAQDSRPGGTARRAVRSLSKRPNNRPSNSGLTWFKNFAFVNLEVGGVRSHGLQDAGF